MHGDLAADPSLIDLAVFVERPPEVAWRALTEPDLVARWLAPIVGFSAIEGTTFMIQADVPGKPTTEIACQVVAADSPDHLAYSWTDLRGDQHARWMVDWKLRAQGRGTRVFLQMSGFDLGDRRQRFARNGLERNWNRTALPYLADVVNSLGRQGIP